MKSAEFVKQLGEGMEFNSNNGWGFGGAVGKRYKLNGCTVTIATAYFRHGKPHKFIRVDAPPSGNYSGSGFIDLLLRRADLDKIMKIILSIDTDAVYLAQVAKYNSYMTSV